MTSGIMHCISIRLVVSFEHIISTMCLTVKEQYSCIVTRIPFRLWILTDRVRMCQEDVLNSDSADR